MMDTLFLPGSTTAIAELFTFTGDQLSNDLRKGFLLQVDQFPVQRSH